MDRTLTFVTGEQGKGRSFTSRLVCYAASTRIWDLGKNDVVRPLFMSLACSQETARFVTANLRLGMKAEQEQGYSHEKKFEFPKSAGYKVLTGEYPHGVEIILLSKGIFTKDPVGVDEFIRFVIMPPLRRVAEEAQRFDTVAVRRHLDDWYSDRRARPIPTDWLEQKTAHMHPVEWLPAMAALFAGFLIPRARAPIVPDIRFLAQLYLAMLREGYASIPCEPRGGDRGTFGTSAGLIYGHGFRDYGCVDPVACQISQVALEDLLAREIQIYRTITRS